MKKWYSKPPVNICYSRFPLLFAVSWQPVISFRFTSNIKTIIPVYNSLAGSSILLINLYARGTKLMCETLALCVSPTPGNSIVRIRGNNEPFFQFITPISCHKPHTFPAQKTDRFQRKATTAGTKSKQPSADHNSKQF
ncbi:MAG: hypothetical protein ACTHLE_06490 [Agriterribacter sp.]